MSIDYYYFYINDTEAGKTYTFQDNEASTDNVAIIGKLMIKDEVGNYKTLVLGGDNFVKWL